MKVMMSAEYKTFFKEIEERIHKAQYDALKAVNKELITLYWDIGKSIVAKQEKLGWGKAIVETLAKDLQKEFPGIQGFSARNLWNMRTFYLAYKDDTKLQPLVAEISWTKNVIIMERCKDDIRREFYIKITKKFGWTKDVLINQLEAGAFKPEYAGKMQFYLSALNDMTKLPEENPSIGIILCKDKGRTIVEYALKDSKKPIGVSTYKLTGKLPRELKKYLPSPEEMIERVKYFE